MARVLLFPESGRPFYLPIRRVLIDDGRFGLFYVPHPTRIVILAIEDLRQDPSRIRLNLGLKGWELFGAGFSILRVSLFRLREFSAERSVSPNGPDGRIHEE